MLEKLRSRLPNLESHTLGPEHLEKKERDAAVLAAFSEGRYEPELILTLRSHRMRSHAGEVAFPGGKVESLDLSLIQTALRESEEEIGLKPQYVELVGQIDAMHSRQGVKVQPIVGLIEPSLDLKPCSEELDAVFKVPVSLFYDKSALTMHRFEMGGNRVEMPAFQYGDFTIWGLTAAMIVNILNQVNDEQIVQPEIRFSPLHK
jgi:8-oxo-dGTP pyrophosphatase MutT (NUDIX family)